MSKVTKEAQLSPVLSKLMAGIGKYMNPMNLGKVKDVASRGVRRTMREATNLGGTAMPQQDIEAARELLAQILGGGATTAGGVGAGAAGLNALLSDKEASAEDAYVLGFAEKRAQLAEFLLSTPVGRAYLLGGAGALSGGAGALAGAINPESTAARGALTGLGTGAGALAGGRLGTELAGLISRLLKIKSFPALAGLTGASLLGGAAGGGLGGYELLKKRGSNELPELLGDKEASAEDAYVPGFAEKCAARGDMTMRYLQRAVREANKRILYAQHDLERLEQLGKSLIREPRNFANAAERRAAGVMYSPSEAIREVKYWKPDVTSRANARDVALVSDFVAGSKFIPRLEGANVVDRHASAKQVLRQLLDDKKASAEDAYVLGFAEKCAAAGVDPEALASGTLVVKEGQAMAKPGVKKLMTTLMRRIAEKE